MSSKIPGGEGGKPVPQKARPVEASSGSAGSAGAAAPCTPPKASASTGSNPGQQGPSWGDYQESGWTWSTWQWNQWTGWFRQEWTGESPADEDPWNGTIDYLVEEPGPSQSCNASASELFEVSEPPVDSCSNEGTAMSTDKATDEAAESDHGSEDSQEPLGKPVSRLYGLMGKMRSTLLSPWAGTSQWGQEEPEGPHSPTDPASSVSDAESAGLQNPADAASAMSDVEPAGPQSPTEPASPTEPPLSEYDPFANASPGQFSPNI